ncbi:MAG TPA: glycosyltransferase family 1 protein [Edaphocola sp.]|nr:glycosyltransferase family 1 protein [Edaphocola sp.]
MNIGFDAKRAFFNKTGLGNYSRSLITALHSFFPENTYQLFTPLFKENLLFPEIQNCEDIQIIHPSRFLPQSIWRSWGITKSFNNTDIYHGLSAELPLGKIPLNTKLVVTIHDLIYERFPELYPRIDYAIYRKKTINACAKAHRIIAVSEQTKRDLIRFYGIEALKINVVYQDCHPMFLERYSEPEKAVFKKKYNLPEQFLLNLGTLEERKNALLILKAMIHLPDDIHLVLVGKDTPYKEKLIAFIHKNQLTNRVHFRPEINFLEFPLLYQSASVFIYPSIFEGFGIPVLEAIKSQVPVIAATGSCLEEAGGADSIFIHPEDALSLKENILLLLNDKAIRARQIQKSFEYALNFSSKNFAKKTMEVYKLL